MIDPDHPRLPVVRQCTLVALSRSTYYYAPRGENAFNRQVMRCIDEQFLATPWYGSRQMARHLRRQGYEVGRKRVRRLMRLMGLTAIYRKPHTSFGRIPSDLSVSSPPSHDGSAESGVVRGRDLYPDAARLSLSGGGHGLGDAHGAFVAAVQHSGQCLLPGGPSGGAGPLRQTGDLQHRPGQTSSFGSSPRFSSRPGSRSRWTARASDGWTTSSSSVSGALSNTSVSICTTSRRDGKRVGTWLPGFAITTRSGLIPAWASGRRWQVSPAVGLA